MEKSAGAMVRSVMERLTATTAMAMHALDPHRRYGEDDLRRLLRNVPGMVYRCRNDAERTMEFVSPGARALTGFDVQDLVGNRTVPYGRLIHLDDRRQVRDAVQRAVLAGGDFEITYRIRRVDGRERRVRDRGAVALGKGGSVEAIEGFVYDATERAELERHHETQKLETLGRLAAGVAHDLNNSFAVIKGTAQVLINERHGDKALTDDLSEIVSAVDRGSALARQLNRFAKTPERTGASLSLGAMIADLAPVLERLLGHGIKLRLAIDPALPDVRMDPAEAEEVVMNLVLSARDALPQGGTLTLSARGIVSEAGGAVEVESDVGIGSRFRALIPAADTE